jgi:hypothetical protein
MSYAYLYRMKRVFNAGPCIVVQCGALSYGECEDSCMWLQATPYKLTLGNAQSCRQ